MADELSLKQVQKAQKGEGEIKKYDFLLVSRKEVEDALWMLAANGKPESIISYTMQFYDALFTDQLTEARNRRAFLLFTEELIKRLRRETGLFASIAFLDFDGFKKINDAHGHVVGDLVLKTAAKTFRKQFPEETLIARLGGDEFVIGALCIEPSKVEERLERARRALNAQLWQHGGATLELDVSFSYSVEEVRGVCGMEKIHELLHNVDRRVSRQKEERRKAERRK